VPRRPPLNEQHELAARGRRATGGLSLAFVALLSACSAGSGPDETGPLGPAAVTPVASLPDAVAAVCAQVVAGLPQQLTAGVTRRATTPSSTATAAWGEPAVTLRCGTPTGSPRDEPFAFDDVRWAMHDSGASRTWTTLAATVPVQVVIPDAYENQAEMLGSLAVALRPALS
jgi:hypothetical protein